MGDTLLMDREVELEIFRSMLNAQQPGRYLRVSGSEKMGKSRLLREFRSVARYEYGALVALIDLRSKLQGYADLLSAMVQQLGEEQFTNFLEIHDEFISPKIEVEGWHILSSLNIQSEGEQSANEHRRRRLTRSFIDDLRKLPTKRPIVLLFDAFEQAEINVQNWINEQLSSGLYTLKQVYIVFAGRQLPEKLAYYADACLEIDLRPVDLGAHIIYCTQLGIVVSEEGIKVLHTVCEGKPGFFIELTYRLPGGAYDRY